jgi:hypothetical protein
MREGIRLCLTSLQSICECSLEDGERREADGGWKEGMTIRMRNFDYFDCW